MRLTLKSLLATSALSLAVAVTANAANFDCTRTSGARVCTGTLQSPTTVISASIENTDGKLSIYRRSSASSSTSTSVALAAGSTTPSATIAPAANASTVTSRTDTDTGGNAVLYATITPIAGATEVTTFTFIEESK